MMPIEAFFAICTWSGTLTLRQRMMIVRLRRCQWCLRSVTGTNNLTLFPFFLCHSHSAHSGLGGRRRPFKLDMVPTQSSLVRLHTFTHAEKGANGSVLG